MRRAILYKCGPFIQVDILVLYLTYSLCKLFGRLSQSHRRCAHVTLPSSIIYTHCQQKGKKSFIITCNSSYRYGLLFCKVLLWRHTNLNKSRLVLSEPFCLLLCNVGQEPPQIQNTNSDARIILKNKFISVDHGLCPYTLSAWNCILPWNIFSRIELPSGLVPGTRSNFRLLSIINVNCKFILVQQLLNKVFGIVKFSQRSFLQHCSPIGSCMIHPKQNTQHVLSY